MTWLEDFERKKKEELEKILSGSKETKYFLFFFKVRHVIYLDCCYWFYHISHF